MSITRCWQKCSELLLPCPPSAYSDEVKYIHIYSTYSVRTSTTQYTTPALVNLLRYLPTYFAGKKVIISGLRLRCIPVPR